MQLHHYPGIVDGWTPEIRLNLATSYMCVARVRILWFSCCCLVGFTIFVFYLLFCAYFRSLVLKLNCITYVMLKTVELAMWYELWCDLKAALRSIVANVYAICCLLYSCLNANNNTSSYFIMFDIWLFYTIPHTNIKYKLKQLVYYFVLYKKE